MAKVEIRLDRAGMRSLLKSQGLASLLGGIASGISSRCGEGYAHDTKQMPSRVIASAYTETPDAMRDCLDNNTLLRCLK